MTHQQQIDALLERYLGLLDEYTRLRKTLAELQSSVYHNIARANFTAERGLRYGRDQYDDRMQALRILHVATAAGEDAVPSFTVKAAKTGEAGEEEAPKETAGEKVASHGDEGGDGHDEDEETEKSGGEREEKAVTKDPLRWFGLFVPTTLRSAQASSIRVVEEVLPRLLTVDAEMHHVEIEVRRARKRRAKVAARQGDERRVVGGDGAVAAMVETS